MNAPLKKSRPQISRATRNVTSSPGTRAGRSRSDKRDGKTTAPSGPAPAPVSHSHLLADIAEQPIQGTFGQTSVDSFAAAGPLSSWENRLRARLAMVGSTEFNLIWRRKVTPAGRSISRLAASTRRTSATGSSGRQNLAGWITPLANDARPGHLHRYTRPDGRNNLNDDAVAITASVAISSWPTPTSLSFVTSHQPGNSRNLNAIRAIAVATHGKTGRSSVPIPKETIVASGSLNTEFVAWLMGVPVAVLRCAPRSRCSPTKRNE